MPMPSASLTTMDKFLIQILSGTSFLISSFWYGHRRIRSVGIANFPLGFALFCKYARPFASKERRAKVLEERKKYDKEKAVESEAPGDPLDDPSFARNCLLWSMAQLLCVASGIFDWYPDTIIKGAVIFHILMTVQDSIETRPILLHQEEIKRKREEKQKLQSAQFWRFFLPKPLWRWLGFEKVVMTATAPEPKTKPDDDLSDDGDHKTTQQRTKEDIIEKVHVAKNIVRGSRETAVDDLIWGAIEIAYVVFDVTHKQALGTAFIVYLCTLLEDVLVISSEDGLQQKKKKIKWFKILWISMCLYVTSKWLFS